MCAWACASAYDFGVRLRAPIFLLALLIVLPAANTFDLNVESKARLLQRVAMDQDFLINVNGHGASPSIYQ